MAFMEGMLCSAMPSSWSNRRLVLLISTTISPRSARLSDHANTEIASWGWECDSVVKGLPNMCETLVIPKHIMGGRCAVYSKLILVAQACNSSYSGCHGRRVASSRP